MTLFYGADGVGDQMPISELANEPTEVAVFQRRVVGLGDRIAPTPDGGIGPRSAKASAKLAGAIARKTI